MKFGVREICDVVFKAKTSGKMGSYEYAVGQPVLYIDSAKTSTLEGAASTVYATGGRGNSRLIAWEGEKTLTFTVEDALLSPMGFAILSGAGLMDAESTNKIYVHTTAIAGFTATTGTVDLSKVLDSGVTICNSKPVFVMVLDKDDSLEGDMLQGFEVSADGKELTKPSQGSITKKSGGDATDCRVLVDFYVEKASAAQQLTIDAENFAGYYYVEAATLFRRQYDGKDLPAEIVFPNVKIQSNFTFNMAATGDPSTFTFTMDAMPGRIAASDSAKKVLCAIQIIDDEVKEGTELRNKDSVYQYIPIGEGDSITEATALRYKKKMDDAERYDITLMGHAEWIENNEQKSSDSFAVTLQIPVNHLDDGSANFSISTISLDSNFAGVSTAAVVTPNKINNYLNLTDLNEYDLIITLPKVTYGPGANSAYSNVRWVWDTYEGTKTYMGQQAIHDCIDIVI